MPTLNDKMTILDKLSFTYQVPIFLVRWTINFWSKRLSKRPISRLHFRQLLALTYMQSLRGTLRPRQLAGLSRYPGTGPRVASFCAKNGLDLSSISIPATSATDAATTTYPDAVLHFIKPKTLPTEEEEGGEYKKRTVVYFHGGGYYNPLLENGHIPWALDITTASKSSRLAILEYSLTPEHRYPCQLVQAVSALRHLLDDQDIPPRDIILAGDSAGGHLILSLLAHITETSPYAPGIDLYGPFRAAVLVSPWVSMTGEEASVKNNEQDDYFSKRSILNLTGAFTSDLKDVYANPWQADTAQSLWDKAFPEAPAKAKGQAWSICKKVIITVGTCEVLLDSCVDFARKHVKCETLQIADEDILNIIKPGGFYTEIKDYFLAVVTGEVHVQPGLDNGLRYKGGLMARAVLNWLETV
jgi:acetyl esterase/lipase